LTFLRTAVPTPFKAPASIETPRLFLGRPRATDAEAIFARYASDCDALRFIGWPAHTSLADTRAFLESSDADWEKWGAGPYIILSRADGLLLGGTGLALESADVAMTGYVLARDAWGQGYATEALSAIVALRVPLRIRRLYAICHVEHRPSWHVLEKCGFVREQHLPRHIRFPNLGIDEPQDVYCYVIEESILPPP
jgi:ribosomal-protein-alanine N-acetyltransferase